jgi:hypothetical protein
MPLLSRGCPRSRACGRGVARRLLYLEASLHYWQARWHYTPGPSAPGTRCHQIQHTIDLLRQEYALKQGLEPSSS